MIACHLGMSEITDTIIVSFHMSAFFIISGYLHRSGKWWPAIKKTAKRLLIPVPFFNLLGYCIWLFQNIDMPFSIKEYITKPYLRIILTIMAFISLCISLYNGGPTWLNFEFGQSFLLFICTSILGSLVSFVFLSLIYKNTFSVVTYLSNNTLTILGIHLLLFPLIPHINHFIGALIVLVLCIPIIWIFNRFIPTLIGNKKQLSKNIH